MNETESVREFVYICNHDYWIDEYDLGNDWLYDTKGHAKFVKHKTSMEEIEELRKEYDDIDGISSHHEKALHIYNFPLPDSVWARFVALRLQGKV